MLGKDLALRVVANGSRLDEAAQVERLGAEHGHLGRIVEMLAGRDASLCLSAKTGVERVCI